MTRLTLIHATRVNGRERSRLLKSTKLPTAPKIVPECMVLNARSLAKPDEVPALYAELSNNNIDTVFPRIIAGGDDYFFPTKRSRLFKWAIISNIAHWRFCPKYFALLLH